MNQTVSDRRRLRVLVIGQGSIGRRHARLLEEAGMDVAAVSRAAPEAFRSLDDVPQLACIGYAVVANDTAGHAGTLSQLAAAGFAGRVLVEKPIFAAPQADVPALPFPLLRVGYNLRTHPVVLDLKRRLADRQVVAVRMHAGQYLPDWRPGTDFRTGSSARRDLGGGVLRDLSHELDLMLFLFGGWIRLVAVRAQRTVLDIETDEAWSIVCELVSGALVTLTLNYHDRPAERRYVATTRSGTIVADVISGVVQEADDRFQATVARDDTYRRMHRDMVEGDGGMLCTYEQGVDVVRMIAAIERSAAEGVWVDNE